MVADLDAFKASYTSALETYLLDRNEKALQEAYQLGRVATQADLHLVDIATIYNETLRTLLARATSSIEELQLVNAAGTFFLESLTSLEMTLRTFEEANDSLRLLNERLIEANLSLEKRVRERTAELRQTVRRLEHEAAERRRAQEELAVYNETLEQIVQERTRALRQTKQHVEAILNSVGEALVVVGHDSVIQLVNPAFEAQTGYSQDEVIGRHYQMFLPDAPPAKELAGQDVSSMREVWRGETEVQRRDETRYDAALTIAPMRDGRADQAAFIAAIRDITPLKEVARMKDAFVSNVSHELRTPITSLKLNHSLLRLDPGQQDLYLDRMGREIDRLNSLIEDLLRLSSLEQGRVSLHLRLTDLDEMATHYVEDRRPLAEARGLTLTCRHAKEPLEVEADANLLGQVVSIFLTNALNYTPSGGRVEVATLVAHLANGRLAGISVSDTGPGISAEDRAQLFERFFRGTVGRESGVGGTGLGLGIAREIVELHGGRIDVESEGVPGKGATFTIWLPL